MWIVCTRSTIWSMDLINYFVKNFYCCVLLFINIQSRLNFQRHAFLLFIYLFFNGKTNLLNAPTVQCTNVQTNPSLNSITFSSFFHFFLWHHIASIWTYNWTHIFRYFAVLLIEQTCHAYKSVNGWKINDRARLHEFTNERAQLGVGDTAFIN